MRVLLIVAVVALLAVAVAGQTGHHVVKETASPLRHWTQGARASPDRAIELIIAVKQQNKEALLETFWAVSDPKNANYGNHLSQEEVHQLVAPKASDVKNVLTWLANHELEVSSKSPNSDMIKVVTTVAKAEQLLHTQYYEYTHSSKKFKTVRTLSYKVSEYVADSIDIIGPTVRFPSHSTVMASKRKPQVANMPQRPIAKKLAPKKTPKDDPCAEATTPACLTSLYTVGSYTSSSPNNSIAVTAFIGQYFSESDLTAFFTNLNPSGQRTPTIIGPNDQTQPGVEASLDIQYSMAMAAGVPATFWSTDANDQDPFMDFMLALNSAATVPFIISTSYGEDEDGLTQDYVDRINVEFQKAGARGISLLYSSGDGGVAGSQPESCTTFIVTFPGGSPYITSVGATTYSAGESAASFSSGGFSNFNPTPSFQSSAVPTYLSTAQNLPAAGLFNASGRGFPDVSALGTNFEVFVSGQAQGVDGTSCSTPAFSGIISLLNDLRFQAGKSSLGYLNTLFYSNPQMFTDITSGNNPGCNSNGFYAAAGWDPITGLGTPLFTTMSSVVKSLP